MTRYFSLSTYKVTPQYIGDEKDVKGRYKGSPSAAAKKMAGRICRKNDITKQCTISVSFRETTQNSKHKEYTYKVKRVKSKEPKTVIRNGKEIQYKYAFKAVREK